MQKLKVYLNKHSKTTNQKIRLNVLKTKQALEAELQRSGNANNNSHSNLGKSTLPRTGISVHPGPNPNTRKRNHSNLHSKSLQQINDFRMQIHEIIKKPCRYDNYLDAYKKQGKQSFDVKKNSKQIASDSRLHYRQQYSNQIEKIIKKNNKSQRKLDLLHFKSNNIKNLTDVSVDVKSLVSSKPVVKQQLYKYTDKTKIQNPNPYQKVPNKKRSKSAHPQNSKKAQPQQPKKKRSSSTKKHNKTKQKQNQQKQQLRIEGNYRSNNPKLSASSRQIELKSMFRTRKGVQIMNPNKVNQDRFFIKQNLPVQHNRSVSIYAVADGHGPFGHCVSHLIVQNLQKRFEYHLKNNKNVEHALDKSFHDIQSLLLKNLQFCADYSGSTLVVLVIENNKRVTCANVGDSRAIVAKQLNKSNWEIIRLSNDHKPNLQEQRARIIAQGGRIETVYDETGKSVGPLRVWLPKKQLQGLAMSRSLGDNISKPIGVTHQPQILIHELSTQDRFILLASDGVWQFLSNYQILSLIIPYYRQNRLEDACQALLRQAYRSWTVEDCSVVDDITFILIFIWGGNVEVKQVKQSRDKQRNNQKQQQKQKQKQKSRQHQKQQDTQFVPKTEALNQQKQQQVPSVGKIRRLINDRNGANNVLSQSRQKQHQKQKLVQLKIRKTKQKLQDNSQKYKQQPYQQASIVANNFQPLLNPKSQVVQRMNQNKTPNSYLQRQDDINLNDISKIRDGQLNYQSNTQNRTGSGLDQKLLNQAQLSI